jgi:pilus assembly protein CpaF
MAFGSATNTFPQAASATSSAKSYQDLKTTLHRELLNKIDLERLTSLQDVRARTQVQSVIYDLIGETNVPLSGAERERICREVLHEGTLVSPIKS